MERNFRDLFERCFWERILRGVAKRTKEGISGFFSYKKREKTFKILKIKISQGKKLKLKTRIKPIAIKIIDTAIFFKIT